MNEQSVASARASVMVYDSGLKKWMPSGSSSGLSKVHIYHHIEHNTFRVVGRKLEDHEVVMNCSILKGLKYFQATPMFHQWRDNSQIHGLNFASRDDAETFALAMERVLDILGHSTSHRSSQSQPLYQTIGHSGVSLDDYAEYRGWMNNENGDRKSNQSEYGHYRSNHVNHSSHPNTPSPGSYSHHRTSSAPPQSPQPLSVIPQLQQQPSPQSAAPPPPPPPPPPPASSNISGLATLPRLHLKAPAEQEEMSENSLAAAIASAKLKKTPKASEPTEKPLHLKGMANMMDEMQRTLARRRAQTENNADADSIGSTDSNKSWGKQTAYSPNKNSSGDACPSLQRSDSDSHRPITVGELEKVRHEMMSEIKDMFNSLRVEITETIRQEFNRR